MDKKKLIVITIFVLIVVLGIGAGYLLTNTNKASQANTGKSSMTSTTSADGNISGIADEKGDTASGVIEKASGKEPGTHKLIRPGGISQTVNLVSSLVDLDAYVTKKVQVWGVTQRVTGSSWFMDVTRLKVVE